jgi:plasmid maintenance system antidote protein VapI
MNISETFKAAIKRRRLTAYAVGKAAGVRPHVIQRFLNGERGLTLATADKLAEALELEMKPKTRTSTSSAPTFFRNHR